MNYVSVLSKLTDGKGTIFYCFILLLLTLYKLFIKKERKKMGLFFPLKLWLLGVSVPEAHHNYDTLMALN